MKIHIALVAAAVLLALTGCASQESDAEREDAPRPVVAMPVDQTAAPETPAPLIAEGDEATPDEAAFLEFVHGRLATFPSQIPDVTDEQLLDAAAVACERIRDGEPVEGMSVIADEVPSEIGGYFYDSNAIIAGAQMHLCQDTLR